MDSMAGPFVDASDESERRKVIRYLTPMEEYVTRARLSHGDNTHLIVSCAIISGPIHLITKESIIESLIAVSTKYLFLRASVKLHQEPGKSLLVEITDLNPRRFDKTVVIGSNISKGLRDVKEVFGNEVEGGRFESEFPWKIIILPDESGKSAAIIRCVDHLVEDGRANQLFYTDFLSNLSKIVSGKSLGEPKKFSFDESLSSSDRRTHSLSYWEIIKEVSKVLYRGFVSSDSIKALPFVPIDERSHVFEFKSLDQEHSIRVVQAAKSLGVTVTSLLAGLALQSLKASCDPNINTSSYTTVLGVDLRGHYEPINGHDSFGSEEPNFKSLFGSHIDVRMDSYSVDNSSLSYQYLSKQFDSDTKDYIQSGRLMKKPLAVEAYIPSQRDLAANQKNGRYAMLHFSNRGIWQVAEDFGEFKIENFFFSGPMKLVGASVLLNVQTVSGRLNFTFTFIDQIFPNPIRSAFLEMFFRLLSSLCPITTKFPWRHSRKTLLPLGNS